MMNGGPPPDHGVHDSKSSEKDLTEVCKDIVHQVLKSLVISTDLMPYTLRAMMKILVMKSENLDSRSSQSEQAKSKPKLNRNQIYMLSELMVGCWLNTGFRNPNCFGVLQPTDREKGFSHNLFQSCRVIFEHLFSLQKLPNKPHHNFNVSKINDYITEYKDFVYIFYTRIIDVELPKMKSQRRSGLSLEANKISPPMMQQVLKYSINSSILRMQDIKLIGTILKE